MPSAERYSPLVRGILMALGIFFTALGFIGLFLPVIPTVPFLIVAAACFTRSSARLENRLLSHPRFGPLLRDWRERGAIPLRAKWMALIGSSTGFILFVAGGHPPWPLAVAVLVMISGAMAFVFSRPNA